MPDTSATHPPPAPIRPERRPLARLLQELGIAALPTFAEVTAPSIAQVRILVDGDVVRTEPPLATPAEAAALDGLSRLLGTEGEPTPASVAAGDPHHPSVLILSPHPDLRRFRDGVHRWVQGSGEDLRQRRALWDRTGQVAAGLIQWEHYGRRVYVIDERTTWLLLSTEVPRLPADLLTSPLPAIHVALPGGIFVVETIWPDGRSGDLPIDGCMVMADHLHGSGWGPRLLHGFTTTSSSETIHQASDSFAMMLAPDLTLDALVDKANKEGVVRHVATGARASIGQMVVNLLLYLDSEHPEIREVQARPIPGLNAKDPTRRARARAQAARRTQIGYWQLGSGEAVDPAELEAGEDGMVTLRRQHWVRGHFRQQPVGPERQQRKITWVRPHRRGVDMGERIRQVGRVPTPDSPESPPH
jgi:hypothetical protein